MVAVPMAQPTPEDEYDYEGLPPNFSVLQNCMAGALAGIAEHTVMFPIDAIKTRMQVLSPSPSAVYNGMVSGGMRIATVEGMASLWRGVTSMAIGAGPAHSLYWVTYEYVKHQMGGNEGGGHHHLASATSGACATTTSEIIMTPFDVIKQRMQVQNSSKMYKSMADCAKHIYRNEGFSAFYVSYPTTLFVQIPFAALQFTVYEALKDNLQRGPYDPVTHCFAGAVGGGIAAAMTTPMDVVKTMLQTRGTAHDIELRSVSGLVEGVRMVHQREGFRGFFKGVKPRVVTAMPASAISWSVYEAFKAYFIRKNEIV